MELKDMLESSGIPASFVADSIGMVRGTFNNKLKGNNGSYFTVFEMDKVREVIGNVMVVLDKFLDDGVKKYNWQNLNNK